MRSYAMNIWVSSSVDSNVKNATGQGSLWRLGNPKADQIIVLAEAWSIRSKVESQWEAEHYIGWAGLTPGAMGQGHERATLLPAPYEQQQFGAFSGSRWASGDLLRRWACCP